MPLRLDLAVINAITTEKIKDKAVTTSKIDWSGVAYSSLPKLNYSTAEQDTGIKWIDGKTLYRKTFITTITATDANAAIRLTSLPTNITIVKFDLLQRRISENIYSPLNSLAQGVYHLYQIKPSGELLCRCNYLNDPIEVTVTYWYTKN